MGMAKTEMAKMMQEPHHVLAMSYKKNIENFALALRGQLERDKTVNAEFARAAVSEIRRSWDEMEKHHAAHHQTMSREMQSKMNDKMAAMQSKHAAIGKMIAALEADAQSANADAKQMLADTDALLKHLDMMNSEKPKHKM